MSDCFIEPKRRREQRQLRTCASLPFPNEHTVALTLLCNVAVQFRLCSHRCLETAPLIRGGADGLFWSRRGSATHLSKWLVAASSDKWMRGHPDAPDRRRWEDRRGRRSLLTPSVSLPALMLFWQLNPQPRFRPGCDKDPIQKMQELGRGARGCAWK